MDYVSKIYTNPIRETGQGVKPHQQEDQRQRPAARGRLAVRRAAPPTPRVATSKKKVDVKVCRFKV